MLARPRADAVELGTVRKSGRGRPSHSAADTSDTMRTIKNGALKDAVSLASDIDD
jgi:hypothetical protein